MPPGTGAPPRCWRAGTPGARVLLHGHTHQASFTQLDPPEGSGEPKGVVVPGRLFLVEHLLARGRLPTADGQPPHLLASITLAYAATGQATPSAVD
jgi:hypothetical protein